MVLYKLIWTETVLGGRTIDLTSTYNIGKIEYSAGRYGYLSGCVDYSVDCANYTRIIAGDWHRKDGATWNNGIWTGSLYARCISYCGTNDGSGTINIYERLFTTSLSISVDKSVVPPNSSFIVSGSVKDQYNNPMKDQVVTIKISKGGTLFWSGTATADSEGNFSKEISTAGWSPDTYKVDVISDDITQSVDVTVVYMSSAKFDAVCLDTGLACPAYVYIDGIPKGITPVTVDNLPVGEHSYKVSREGYSDVTGTVNVQQGVTAEINVTLTPAAKGSIFFNSKPSGAAVFIDGVEYEEKTPITVLNIPIGTHSYVLKLDGFKDYEGSVLVEANATSTVDVTLTPSEGCIYFASNPAGAKIIVDEVDTGKVTPDIICGLSLGSHTYRLELAGYKAITGSVGIGAGEGRTVSEALVKEGAGAGTVLGIVLLAGILGAVIVSRRR